MLSSIITRRMADVRKWTVLGPVIELDEGLRIRGEVDRDTVREALMDAETMIFRAGGHVTMTSDRQPHPAFDGEFFTSAVQIKWLSRADTSERTERPSQQIEEEFAYEPDTGGIDGLEGSEAVGVAQGTESANGAPVRPTEAVPAPPEQPEPEIPDETAIEPEPPADEDEESSREPGELGADVLPVAAE